METITATELKQNLGKYLALAATSEFLIMKNNRVVARLGSPYPDRVAMVHSLAGILDTDMTLEEAREERLSGK